MATNFRIGSSRRTNISKPVYLPEARSSANAVGQVLVAKYGQQQWLLQIMEMVMVAVDRGIKQLGGSAGPTENATGSLSAPATYALPARTREDVERDSPGVISSPSDSPVPGSQHLVQQGLQTDHNDLFAVLSKAADPATRQLGHGLPGQAVPQPMQEIQESPGGLLMPNGVPAIDQSTSESADSGWLM